MNRLRRIHKQLSPSTAAGGDAPKGLQKSLTAGEAIPPPVVPATKQTSDDPITFLRTQAAAHPDLFMVDRGGGYRYVVVSDVSMYEDILTFDNIFGNPITPNMSVNKNIFQIPAEQLEAHEQNTVAGLRHFLLNNCEEMSDAIAAKLITYMRKVLGEEGEMDLRDLGEAIFWPMTEALIGEKAGVDHSPFLFKAFEDIDNQFGAALRGHKIPQVEAGVTKAYTQFSQMVKEANSGGCPMGPLVSYYDNVTKSEDPDLTAKFTTAGWWGGQGNTLPSTVWSFGHILANPEAKKKAYAEVDTSFASQPNKDGHYDYSTIPYITAALKETLRLCTYSIAWRHVQKDTTLTAKSGKTYKLEKGTLIGLHFALRHFDETVYDNPEEFRPERYIGYGAGLSPIIDGKPYAWVPFSAGRHKCSGYPLAMLEIPVVMALVFREYNMELLDPLPGYNFRQAFGVIGPDDKPVRVKYTKRR